MSSKAVKRISQEAKELQKNQDSNLVIDLLNPLRADAVNAIGC